MENAKDEQRLYIIDSNGLPIGYLFMGGSTLYAMDGKIVAKVSMAMTIEELKRVLTEGVTQYIT